MGGRGGGSQKDVEELVVAFSNFADAPQNKFSHCNDKLGPKTAV